MQKLPKAIIKKYGISKKAWQVFRNTRGRKNPTTKRGNTTMARKHYSRKGNSSGLNAMVVAPIAGAAYGFVRPMAANAIPDFMGAYTDNVVLGGVAAGVAYFSKGVVRQSALQVLGIEAFIATSKAASGSN